MFALRLEGKTFSTWMDKSEGGGREGILGGAYSMCQGTATW